MFRLSFVGHPQGITSVFMFHINIDALSLRMTNIKGLKDVKSCGGLIVKIIYCNTMLLESRCALIKGIESDVRECLYRPEPV
jgi:hypothetical protein